MFVSIFRKIKVFLFTFGIEADLLSDVWVNVHD